MNASWKRRLFSFDLVAAALLLVAAWASYQHFEFGRAQFVKNERDLQLGAGLARQIELLRKKPDRAALESRTDQALAEAIEKSAANAGVARERIARIEPQQPRRAGDTDYLEHATVAQLDGVTLAQLAEALKALRGMAGLDQLRVSVLRISAPYQASASEGPEAWNIEMTLTYLVYSPKPPARQKS